MSGTLNTLRADEMSYLFEPASWMIKIDFINQFILNNNALISLLGEKGSGKTSFAQLLHDKVDANVLPVLMTATPTFELNSFLKQISAIVELNSTQSIAEIVNEINARQSLTLLIIDDAHLLPESFVCEILDALKLQNDKGYFHVAFLSDFSLVSMTSKLAKEDYKDLIHSVELQPLSESEMKEYVLTRIIIDKKKGSLISEVKFQKFYQLTEGYIASINVQAEAFFADKNSPFLKMDKRIFSYGIIPIIALFVVGVGYIFISQDNIERKPLSIAADTAMDSIQVELPMVSQIPPYYQNATIQPMPMISLQKADVILQDGGVSEENDGLDQAPLDESLAVMGKVVSTAKVIKTVPALKKKELTMAKPKNPIMIAQPRRPIPRPIVPPRPIIHQQKNLPKVAKQVDVNAKPLFTIQLLASQNQQQLIRVAKTYPASLGVKVLSFVKGNDTWYVLAKGKYNDRHLAQKEISKLSSNFKARHPWVRSMSDLHNVG